MQLESLQLRQWGIDGISINSTGIAPIGIAPIGIAPVGIAPVRNGTDRLVGQIVNYAMLVVTIAVVMG